MAITQIANLESASTVRTKLNEMIEQLNTVPALNPEAVTPIASGGTGGATIAEAQTALEIQPRSAELDEIAALTGATVDQLIVHDGTQWIARDRNAVTGTGWGNYADDEFDASNSVPVTLTSLNALTQITNDGLASATVLTHLPQNLDNSPPTVNLLVGDAIQAVEGDAFDLRISFDALPAAIDSWFDIVLDIGDPGNTSIVIASQTIVLPKGITTTRVVATFPIFAGATFEANGCRVYIDTSLSGDTVDVSNVAFFIKQDFRA